MNASSGNTAMRLCKDCKHFAPFVYTVIFWRVRGPMNLAKCSAFTDPVSGDAGRFCEIERDSGSKCGRDGNLWEAA